MDIFNVTYTETKTTTYTVAATLNGDLLSGTVNEATTDKCEGTCTGVSLDPDCSVDYPIAGFQVQVEPVHST